MVKEKETTILHPSKNIFQNPSRHRSKITKTTDFIELQSILPLERLESASNSLAQGSLSIECRRWWRCVCPMNSDKNTQLFFITSN